MLTKLLPGKVQSRSTQAASRIMPRSYLAGLQLSNDGSAPNTTIDVAAGMCRDSTDAFDIQLAAFTKTKSNPFVAGSGNAGATVAIGNSTWAHVFAAIINGAADIFLDTSITAANKPAGTTAFRRIGSILTDGSGNIRQFIDVGDFRRWKTSILDINAAAISSTPANGTISVPPGLRIFANFQALPAFNTGFRFYIYSPDDTDEAAGPTLGSGIANGPGTAPAYEYWTTTDTSGRIRFVAESGVSGSPTMTIRTLGYRDFRGQYD